MIWSFCFMDSQDGSCSGTAQRYFFRDKDRHAESLRRKFQQDRNSSVLSHDLTPLWVNVPAKLEKSLFYDGNSAQK